jgi:hypothetical protein
VLLLAALVLWSACKDSRRFKPGLYSPTAVDNALMLGRVNPSITADGSSTTDIVATVDKNSALDRRTVEFTASTGSFVGAPEATPRQIKADAVRGEARVKLKSSTKVETALIDAVIKDGNTVLASAHTTVDFVAAGLSTIQLTASPASIPADGFSRTTLVATISPDTPSDRRKVIFTATKGTLVNGAVDNGLSKVEVVAGRDNTARAELVSSKSLETSIVTATLDGVTGAVDRVTVRFEAPNPSDLIKISTSVASAPADGMTVVQVSATVAPNLPEADRAVAFTTTAGTFVDSNTKQTTRTADASNRATVDLKVDSSIVTAVLRATAGVATAETTLPFVQALPDFIVVDPKADKIKSDGTEKVAIEVKLYRNVGKVTQGTVVTFSAVDDAKKPVSLLFRDVTPSNADGLVTANVIAPDNTPAGTVTIRAIVKVGTTEIVGEEKIVVVD